MFQLAVSARIRGPIDVTRFERAAARLVIRHPILCSRLTVSDGEVVQWRDSPRPSFECIDVSGGTERQADLLLSARADDPVDMFRENPFRIVLARTDPDQAFLLLMAHHLFFDWSCIHKLFQDYLELLRAGSDRVAEPPWSSGESSYLSYCRREQEMVRDGTYDRRASYWLDYLDQADPTLHLPHRPPDPAQVMWDAVPLKLSPESTRAFSDRARRLGVSNFQLTAATIFHTLRELTGQDDLLLSASADARRPPFLRTVGQFADFFILRQRGQDAGLSDDAIRAAAREAVTGMTKLLPFHYFADQLGWLGDRVGKGFSMTEANVNFQPVAPVRPKSEGPRAFEISPFSLTARDVLRSTPYHGVALSWVINPWPDAMAGWIRYDSTLVRPEVAQAVATSWLNAVS